MKRIIIICVLALTTFGTAGLAQKIAKKKTTAATANSSAAPSPANGKVLYTKYCLSCHQADGGGVENLNPPLIKTSYVLGDKVRLSKIVLNGFSERVEIEGEYYNNVMPSFNYLKDKEIADILTYVRSNFGNKASTVSAAEVAKVRAGK
jgi:mono/diheme cytochrome c family protein